MAPLMILVSFCFMLVYIYLNEDHEGGEDNILLFLRSKYGFQHPEQLYATPIKILFSMIMSIPAQIGFKAVQITNALLACASSYIAIGICKKMNLTNHWFLVLLILFSPIYFVISLTALSEIMFSFALIACISLVQNQKYFWSALLLSFLPYIRSEGFILILVFITYFIFEKQWKILPLLLVGTLFFCLSGYSFHHDFLWVFNKNYGDASNLYGRGPFMHFLDNSRWFNGYPLTLILGFSLLMVLIYFKKLFHTNRLLLFLVFGCYFGFLLLHSFLWWQGMGASIGLVRVMACVMPLAGIIAIWTLSHLQKYMFGLSAYVFILFSIVHINGSFNINKLPRKLDEHHSWIYKMYQQGKPMISKAPKIKFTSYYFAFLSDIDIFEEGSGDCWSINPKSLDQLPKGSVVQYETSFGPNECNIDTFYFERERPDLQKVVELYAAENVRTLNNYRFKTVLYIKK